MLPNPVIMEIRSPLSFEFYLLNPFSQWGQADMNFGLDRNWKNR